MGSHQFLKFFEMIPITGIIVWSQVPTIDHDMDAASFSEPNDRFAGFSDPYLDLSFLLSQCFIQSTTIVVHEKGVEHGCSSGIADFNAFSGSERQTIADPLEVSLSRDIFI